MHSIIVMRQEVLILLINLDLYLRLILYYRAAASVLIYENAFAIELEIYELDSKL